MKVTKLIVVSLLIVASLAYAKKEAKEWAPGLKGFSKPDCVPVVVTNDPSGVIFVDLGINDPKGKVQISEVDSTKTYCVSFGQVKSFAQKGKTANGSTLDTIFNTNGVNGVAFKLKGITVGTVVAAGVKSAQIDKLTGSFNSGAFAKGTSLKANGEIAGKLAGNFKAISTKGAFAKGVDGTEIVAPGKKISFKAKTEGGEITVKQDVFDKCKKPKGVKLVVEGSSTNATESASL